MPLTLKTFTDFTRLIQGKFLKEIPEIDPTVKASFARASTVSTAAGAVSLQEGITDAVNQSFWQTADDDFLELIGSYDNTVRFDPQAATGFASVPGVLSTAVPISTSLTYGGNSYLTTVASSVINFTGTLALTLSAGIVTAVTAIDHTLSTGLSVVISGASQGDYNGVFEITVLDSTTFTYELVAGALTGDSGSYSSDYALLSIESVGTGSIQNAGPAALMAISVTDIDPNAFVGVDGISGGLDQEDIEDYRTRVGEAHNLTPGIATSPSIVFSAKSVAGVTRVLIVRPDGVVSGTPGVPGYKPDLGEVVVYILRDDDVPITPDAGELTTVKDQILADGLWPSFLPDAFLYVMAPILVEQDFNFTTIVPNTTTMQAAIDDQLDAFFEDTAEIEGTITLDTLNTFLSLIQDPTTGEFLSVFEYDDPSADMVAATGEIFVKGTVVFE